MRGFDFGTITIIVFLLGACGKENDCEGYSAGTLMDGFAYAEGSYQNFGDYAIYVRDRITDTLTGGWMHDEMEVGLLMTGVDKNSCLENIQIYIANLTPQYSDTIWVLHSQLGTSKEFPTASCTYMDGDASIETYELLHGTDNWLIIDEVCPRSQMSGRFNLSFVTSYEPYLTGQQQRWDDPLRTDTLNFKHGTFRAVYQDW